MSYVDLSCVEFTTSLASKAPVPGGGGASALAGALGVALGNMVGNLTLGKPKYAEVQADIAVLMAKAAALQAELLALVEKDAEVFEPLSRAYGLPKDTPAQQAEKARVMEEALEAAAAVPLAMMERCCEAIELHAGFAEKGSAIAISDVGVGVALCKAALKGAALNVFINTKTMQNRTAAEAFNLQANQLLEKYEGRADAIYDMVAARLK